MFSPLKLLEFLLSLFVISLFLLLGADKGSQLLPRLAFGGFLLGGFLLFFCRDRSSQISPSPFPLPQRGRGLEARGGISLFFFFFFFIFTLTRFLTALWQANIGKFPEDPLLLSKYLSSPFDWAFYLGFFILSVGFFSERGRAERFSWLLAWCGFGLALSAFPPLLIEGELGYLAPEGAYWFFPTLFYSHPFLTNYIFGTYTNVNYIGDLIALGFFPALGLLLYSFHRGEKPKHRFSFVSIALPACLAGASVLAVTLILARGTMISFGVALSFYLGMYSIKFPSRRHFLITAGVVVLIVGFLVSGGHLERVWKELGTVKGDIEEKTASSFAETKEGIRRALRIYKDYPLWGAGTGGYRLMAERYASPGTNESYFNARVRAMCHYAQLLAEEGAGAFVYFLFLLAYFFEVFRGLMKTQSRFQFLAGLSLFCAVLMIFIHGSIHYLLQQFSISLLVYILMGASLAALRADFRRD